MSPAASYTDEHQRELDALLATRAWQQVLRSGLVQEVSRTRLQPGTRPDFIDTVVEPLLQLNQPYVECMLRAGERDTTRLADALGRWPESLDGWRPQLSFLGLNVTAACNCVPHCLYCNQQAVPEGVGIEGWKEIIAEVTAVNQGSGPYMYITGGEPLVLGERLWGEEGLVAYATQRGAAVNINTNALELTPRVALRLVQSGLARLHISLDTADEELQNYLMAGDRQQAVLRGIANIQIARDLLGVTYPEIHTNCVLTRHNWALFPDLFRFILRLRRRSADRRDPLYQDLFPHVIPVGGDSNAAMRPSATEFHRFYTEVWPEVCNLWDTYQAELGLPPKERGVLFGYFSNPFLRVSHRGGLNAYVETSARGRYGALALARRCYVAPTQASFTPDGRQYRCGSHAIRRIHAIGQYGATGVYDSISAGLRQLTAYPDADDCYGCALATLYINQAVEQRLEERAVALLAGEPQGHVSGSVPE